MNNGNELRHPIVRQVLGTHKALDINVRTTLLNISDGISVGLIFEGIVGFNNKNNNTVVENTKILNRCIPHIYGLRQIVAEEMDIIVRDNSLDSLTVLAAAILKSILSEDDVRKDLQ